MLIHRTNPTVAAALAALLLGGCGGAEPSGGAESASVTVVAAPSAAVPAPLPSPIPTPDPAAASPADAVEAGDTAKQLRKALPPLDLSDMSLWNWGGRWHASEWNNGMGPIPWKYDRVKRSANGDVRFTLDSAGAPQLQAMGGTPVSAQGLWEVDVTLPQLKEGLVVAPLWLWDSNSRDEIDFEFAGRGGLDVSLHSEANGAMQRNTVRLFPGRDMSGERHRFGIRIDQAAGHVDMFFDGVRVHRWNRRGMGFFVSRPLKPMIEMWAADPNNSGFVYWVGRWAGLASGQSLTMTVHGYRYTPGV